MKMLEINNLSVSYGVISAIKELNISIEQGQIVSLIGANGAGKTTLLKTISGLIKQQKGTIIFKDEDISKTLASDLPKKGLVHVPEGRRIFSGLTVLENLMMGAYFQKNRDQVNKDLKKIYERFQILYDRRHQNASTLSGGEQQMLAISRALMARPTLLLMDEPSMGLAPLLVREIFSIIEEINNDGTTILLVEQNAHQALKIADYAYVLETGKIMMEGSGESLLASDEVAKIYLGG